MKRRKPGFKEEFKRRVSETRSTRWVRFGVVALLFILWVAWLGNWWFALLLFLLFDIYITGFIPFTWWKRHPNKMVRTVMSWVDAIVYALILVYFIFTFLGQNYMIPSSSLEKTLLTGDYLVVNKVTYGPRVPITPVHFPLVHNKLPILNTNSYTEWPTNEYRRLKGLRNVEWGDIVVFNFPAGDTVALKMEEAASYYDLVDAYGWNRVNNDEQTFGKVVFRPVDRRTNYVKRCVGLPGQTLRIDRDTIYIDGEAMEFPENVQFRYIVNSPYPWTANVLEAEDINADEVLPVSLEQRQQLALYTKFNPTVPNAYNVPLTQKMIDNLKAKGYITDILKVNDIAQQGYGSVFPKGLSQTWSISDWGGERGVLIPQKGMTVPLTSETWQLYERCIRNYENHPDAYFSNGKAYIDGQEASSYTFGLDYYFMMGDNRDNSLDSRFWGFVPEDHIVGTPLFVVVSFDKDRSIFNGGIRWSRIFKDANPDK